MQDSSTPNAQCQFIDNCAFFNCPSENNAEKGWKRAFCNVLQRSESCARKQYRLKHDKKPPDQMTPLG